MAHYYGTLAGRRDTTRHICGTKDSGVLAAVQSDEGSVIVALTHTRQGELVQIGIAKGSTPTAERIILQASLAELTNAHALIIE